MTKNGVFGRCQQTVEQCVKQLSGQRVAFLQFCDNFSKGMHPDSEAFFFFALFNLTKSPGVTSEAIC